MNVVIEDDSKKNNKLKIFYILILVVCIIAVMVTVVIQVSGGEQTISSGKLPELTESEIDKHKNDFYNIFQNKVNYLENNSYKISKVEANEEIIYVGYHNNESKINDFELDVNIPYININNNIIEKFNTQIKEIFEKKAKSILNSQNNNVIYTVNYSAYVSNNILSLIVRSTLKEGSNPQRDIIQTYNYNLTTQKEYTIDEMLEIKGITKKEANQKIKGEIKKAQEKSEELQKLGYSTYARDYTSDMYSINNVTEYFIGKDNALYIIYAYGNENNTNEMDVVVM
ncbi:MAG: hypothetical protein V8R51_06145 [Clostridia bacterium]